jgi:hypothetical protein
MLFSPEEEARISQAKTEARRAWRQAFGERAPIAPGEPGVTIFEQKVSVAFEVSGLAEDELVTVVYQPALPSQPDFYLRYAGLEVEVDPLHFSDELGLQRAIKQYHEYEAATHQTRELRRSTVSA